MSEPTSAADFHRLGERLRIHGRVVARSGLHVGAGTDPERASCELPVTCDAEGFPFIPGSTLKGALRSTVEGLLRAAELDGLRSCDPLDERQGKSCASRREAICAVCSVFGTRGLASHVRISDAPASERGGSLPIELREGVGIDRDLRTAHTARRYELEVVPAGTAFDLEIFVDNPQPWMLGLLLVGLDQLDAGFASLGGFASRGLGRVCVQILSIERASARALLSGEGPERVEGDALCGELDAWRRALVPEREEVAACSA
jgi:CRISPR-associated protein Csm3